MDWYGLAISALTGAFAIFGTIIGSSMGRKTEMKRQKKELIIDSYAKFVACTLDCCQHPGFQSAKELTVATSRLGLVCSKESKEIVDEIATLAMQYPIDRDAISNLLDQLSERARKEIV